MAGLIEHRVVVGLEDWERLWEKYRLLIRSEFENIRFDAKLSEEDRDRSINYRSEQFERHFLRCKGELDGTFRPSW